MNLSQHDHGKLLHTDYRSCFHCHACSGICPFSGIMDAAPNKVVKLVQMGRYKDAMSCGTIWVCVGCNTCVSNCPMEVNIPELMDFLREKSIELNVPPKEPEILTFHQTVIDSISKYGRTHKLEIMMRYKLASRDLATDFSSGIKMLFKRKIDLSPSRVKRLEDIRDMFSNQGETGA